MAETQTKWIGLPTPEPVTDLQRAHLTVSVIVHILCTAAAVSNIVTFTRSTELRLGPTKWHNWIILYITVADLLLNVFQFAAVLHQISHGGWYLSDTWCQFQGFTSALAGFMSVNGVFLLTQERTLTILWQKQWTAVHTVAGFVQYLSLVRVYILETATCLLDKKVGFTVVQIVSVHNTVEGHGTPPSFSSPPPPAFLTLAPLCGPLDGGVLRPQNNVILLRRVSSFVAGFGLLTNVSVLATYGMIWYSVRKAARTVMWLKAKNNHKAKTTMNKSGSRSSSTHKLSAARLGPPEFGNIKRSMTNLREDRGTSAHSVTRQHEDVVEAAATAKTAKESASNFKLENEIAAKSTVVVFAFIIGWLPTIGKILTTVITAKPVSRRYDMSAALTAISPGFFNPMVNILMDTRWRTATKQLLQDIRHGFKKLSPWKGELPSEC
ncbi:hypothetical protein PhCBS80983_g03800 [Powellomyces hirtus]|uniref:G-protein coupled receptors family 1 profile domain-containing protein n=1 Tax=Powellomyces hirtus TaxID=109895 RepID=A0A507E0Z6_9FUNG|nr:hypothetical protein PhCBS80983_g03800 [Powellomyces hirtus]